MLASSQMGYNSTVRGSDGAMSEEARPATRNCPRCGRQGKLVWFESEAGFFESGYYCEGCSSQLEEEEDQVDDLDLGY